MCGGLGRYWNVDPVILRVAFGVSLLFGGFVALFIAAFRPLFARADWLAFAAFATVMFALPYGWENTLEGFNSQWYFLLLASLGGLMAIVPAAAFGAVKTFSAGMPAATIFRTAVTISSRPP